MGLIDSGGTQQNNRIIEDVAVWVYFFGFYANLLCTGFNAAYKMFFSLLASGQINRGFDILDP